MTVGCYWLHHSRNDKFAHSHNPNHILKLWNVVKSGQGEEGWMLGVADKPLDQVDEKNINFAIIAMEETILPILEEICDTWQGNRDAVLP